MGNEDKSARYHRLRRRASVLSTAVVAAVLILLIVTPASRFLAGAARGYVTPYVILLAIIIEALMLPFAFQTGWRLERKYGLSREPAAAWLRDHLKGVAIGLPIAAAA